MKGERHVRPVDYNCPCNVGRRTWIECVNCEARRYPMTCEFCGADVPMRCRNLAAVSVSTHPRCHAAYIRNLSDSVRLARLEGVPCLRDIGGCSYPACTCRDFATNHVPEGITVSAYVLAVVLVALVVAVWVLWRF